ncbi:MAG: prepilin peptidase [Acetivibrio sp.]
MPDLIFIAIYMVPVLFGMVIGSFLNVCIFRIPKKESIVLPRSHCMDCGCELKWYDLVPVFSYIALRGRCRSCKKKISIQYPIIEGLNGMLYLFVFLANGWKDVSILYCLMSSALIVIAVIDWRTFEIPVSLNVFLLILGVIRVLLDYKHVVTYLAGFFSVSLFLYFLFWITKGRGIGGGDIKLMAVSGLLLGWQKNLLGFFLACILGSVIHLYRMKRSGENHVLALGPYLAVGIFISALFGETMIQWYLHAIGI